MAPLRVSRNQALVHPSAAYNDVGEESMTREPIYRFWEHGQSGAVFAVRLDQDERLTGCCGPLLSNEISASELPFYFYDENPKDLAWIEGHRENWVPFEF